VVRFISVALVTLAVLSTVPSAAQNVPQTKWYASADVGTAKMGVPEFTFGRPVAPEDRKSTAFRLRGGYQFVRFFALEASYADLGSYSTRVDMQDCGPTAAQCFPDFGTELDLESLGLFGVGILPISDRLAFRATVGFSARRKRTHQVPDGAPDYTRTTTAMLPGFGVGAGFAVTRKLDVYAEWNRYEGENSDGGLPVGELQNPGTIGEGDLSIFSLGARWRF
jgi:OmpA-OmpF porin, OOP family